MTARANGTFEPETKPLTGYVTDPSAQIGRFSLDKKYHGELEGTAKGEMLTAGNPAKGSAGYVAVEFVTGTLKGRSGSFALQHTGVMTRGTPSLNVTVVPDSGTGELVGLLGKMDIIIEGKEHSYVLDYDITKN